MTISLLLKKIGLIPIIKERIEITPGVCGGKPRIVGHSIRVQDIVIWHELRGMSPDEILECHSSISLADVYTALAKEIKHHLEFL